MEFDKPTRRAWVKKQQGKPDRTRIMTSIFGTLIAAGIGAAVLETITKIALVSLGAAVISAPLGYFLARWVNSILLWWESPKALAFEKAEALEAENVLLRKKSRDRLYAEMGRRRQLLEKWTDQYRQSMEASKPNARPIDFILPIYIKNSGESWDPQEVWDYFANPDNLLDDEPPVLPSSSEPPSAPPA